MRKLSSLIVVAIISVGIFLTLAATTINDPTGIVKVSAATTSDNTDEEIDVPDGLYKDGDSLVYYYKNGKPVTNRLVKVKSGDDYDYYYFTGDGSAFTGGYKAVTVNDKTQYYFFKKNGKAVKNKLKKVMVNKTNYYFYFGKKGRALKTTWKTIDGDKYYFNKRGHAVTGTKTIGHYYCKFNSKGILERRIDKDGKLIALTYDDGPSVNTPTILETLKKYDSVATFFVVGERVSPYSDYVKQAYDQGCEIANHTYNHKILTSVSTSTIKSQIKKTNAAVKNVTGEKPKLMRPPGGANNDTVRSAVGMPLIIWSVDTLDWKTRDASKTISAIKASASDGDIVLMHDLYEPTANASKKIIPYLVKHDFQLVTVSELAACKGVKLIKGNTYTSIK